MSIRPVYITKLNRNSNITKSNKLVEARYKLNTTEQKIIYAIISTIRLSDSDFSECIFKVKDLADFCNISVTNRYNEIKNATEALLSRVLNITVDQDLIQTHWVQSARYSKGGGIVTFKIDNELKPYLLELKEAFTSIKVQELMSFKSSYTARLYELISQYRKIGERKIELEDLKQKLFLSGKSYSLFSNIKNRIIEPAIKEINSNTILNIKCEYQSNTSGRKVTHILFIIEIKDKKPCSELFTVDEIKNSNIYSNEVMQDEDLLDYMLLQVGLEKEYSFYKKSKYSFERIIKNIEYTLNYKNVDNISNFARSAIAGDYAEVDEKSLFNQEREKDNILKYKKVKLNNIIHNRIIYQKTEEGLVEAEKAFKQWYLKEYKEEYSKEMEEKLINDINSIKNKLT